MAVLAVDRPVSRTSAGSGFLLCLALHSVGGQVEERAWSGGLPIGHVMLRQEAEFLRPDHSEFAALHMRIGHVPGQISNKLPRQDQHQLRLHMQHASIRPRVIDPVKIFEVTVATHGEQRLGDPLRRLLGRR